MCFILHFHTCTDGVCVRGLVTAVGTCGLVRVVGVFKCILKM